MPHYGSSGAPYPPTDDVGPFAPSGAPKRIQKVSGASAETDAEFDEALGEFAALGKKTRSTSLKNEGQRVPIPLDSEGLAKSPYNRP